MNDREQTTAELLLQVQALEGVADRLESERVYERQLVRASASRIRRLALDLNNLAGECEEDDGA